MRTSPGSRSSSTIRPPIPCRARPASSPISARPERSRICWRTSVAPPGNPSRWSTAMSAPSTARPSEGVTTLINGNSGKDPAGTPSTGGFTGWTMLGIDPGSGVVGADPAHARSGRLARGRDPSVGRRDLRASAPSSSPWAAGARRVCELHPGRTHRAGRLACHGSVGRRGRAGRRRTGGGIRPPRDRAPESCDRGADRHAPRHRDAHRHRQRPHRDRHGRGRRPLTSPRTTQRPLGECSGRPLSVRWLSPAVSRCLLPSDQFDPCVLVVDHDDRGERGVIPATRIAERSARSSGVPALTRWPGSTSVVKPSPFICTESRPT